MPCGYFEIVYSIFGSAGKPHGGVVSSTSSSPVREPTGAGWPEDAVASKVAVATCDARGSRFSGQAGGGRARVVLEKSARARRGML